ncbi:hypothetical protein F3Y22_tig00117002pilonHSYRG00070 [Hibiscus syriacus]|uniref:Uncharacterized protein n=1 Tax=Hibiscus syriacus TaxID=106335 RepID=A0A6A2XR77_HIBSY|nr:hypothetical protein F3Y22_tig00117002pilonHSYRG00070 [Hibiscus syriacus]
MLAASVAVTVGEEGGGNNLAALEHCVRRDDDNIRDHDMVGRRGGYLEDVLRVSLHDLAGHDGAADLFNVAI